MASTPGGPQFPFLPRDGFLLNGSKALRLLQTSTLSFLVLTAAQRPKPRTTRRSDQSSGTAATSSDLNQLIESALNSFPLKAALTASSLALAGDSIAQFRERYRRRKAAEEEIEKKKPCCRSRLRKEADEALWQHDFVRALRMGSYGFLLYGPGSHAWYQMLDKLMPQQSLKTITAKVVANQLILGPCVLLVVFAWNMAWMGKAKNIPDKYRRDFVPALVDGWKFWVPAACVNFSVVPLEARVAYMSCCSIFWNFYLSSSVGKEASRVNEPNTNPQSNASKSQ